MSTYSLLGSPTRPEPARFYVAGPMTGHPNWNFSEFHRVTEELRALGYSVTNPAENFEGRTDLPYDTYIRTAIPQVMSCDALVMLPFWRDSIGANAEVAVAKALGLPIYDASAFEEGDGLIAPLPFFGSPLLWWEFGCGCDAEGRPCDRLELPEACGFEPIPVGAEWRCLNCGHRQSEHGQPARLYLNDVVADAAAPDPDAPQLLDRVAVLEEARDLITGDRNESYGSPVDDFGRTAGMLNSQGYRRITDDDQIVDLVPSDVAIFMADVKLSRLMSSRGKRDSWVDLAGYAGCGAECAIAEGGQP